MFTKLLSLLRNEFQAKNFRLTHFPLDDFVKSEWQTTQKSCVFLAYRWLIALIFIMCIAISMSENNDVRSWAIWFIYLTNWGLLLCFITTTLGAVLVTIWNFRLEFPENPKDENKIPLIFQIYWILGNISLTISIIITIIYWSTLHERSETIDVITVVSHLINSITMFIDFLIVAYPLRLVHVVYTIGFGLIYLLFSLIYHWTGGTNFYYQPYIYYTLDWSNTGLAVSTVIVALVLATIVHLLMFGVYKLRSHVGHLQK